MINMFFEKLDYLYKKTIYTHKLAIYILMGVETTVMEMKLKKQVGSLVFQLSNK
jgi:hypothetical protein